jgi:hypothetical protein
MKNKQLLAIGTGKIHKKKALLALSRTLLGFGILKP